MTTRRAFLQAALAFLAVGSAPVRAIATIAHVQPELHWMAKWKGGCHGRCIRSKFGTRLPSDDWLICERCDVNGVVYPQYWKIDRCAGRVPSDADLRMYRREVKRP